MSTTTTTTSSASLRAADSTAAFTQAIKLIQSKQRDLTSFASELKSLMQTCELIKNDERIRKLCAGLSPRVNNYVSDINSICLRISSLFVSAHPHLEPAMNVAVLRRLWLTVVANKESDKDIIEKLKLIDEHCSKMAHKKEFAQYSSDLKLIITNIGTTLTEYNQGKIKHENVIHRVTELQKTIFGINVQAPSQASQENLRRTSELEIKLKAAETFVPHQFTAESLLKGKQVTPFAEKPRCLLNESHAKDTFPTEHPEIEKNLLDVQNKLKGSSIWNFWYGNKEYCDFSFALVYRYISNSMVGNHYYFGHRYHYKDLAEYACHGKVLHYLELCLDVLPENVRNNLAKFCAEFYLDEHETQSCYGMRALADLLICSRCTDLNTDHFALAAYHKNQNLMENCLRNAKEPIDLTKLNIAGVLPFSFASEGNIEYLLKCGALSQADYKNAYELHRISEEYLILSKIDPTSSRRDPRSSDNYLFNLGGRYHIHKAPTLKASLVKLDKPYNASWLVENQVIACEAPLKTTQEDFYGMLVSKQMDVVVMLTNFTEDDRQCYPYLKSGTYGKYKVAVKSEKVLYTNGDVAIVERHLTINKQKITHVQIVNWPDQNVIKPVDLANAVDIVLKITNNGKLKVVGHCMAGLGRTGTFFATMFAALGILNGESSDNIVRDKAIFVRKGRAYAITRRAQYHLLYTAFDYWMKNFRDKHVVEKAQPTARPSGFGNLLSWLKG